MARCGLLLALRTGGASSPDPHDNTIRIWDAETGAAVGEPLEGHNGRCGLLLALRTGGASSPDPQTTPFESGMPRLVLQLVSL
jgi:hypothetical protein